MDKSMIKLIEIIKDKYYYYRMADCADAGLYKLLLLPAYIVVFAGIIFIFTMAVAFYFYIPYWYFKVLYVFGAFTITCMFLYFHIAFKRC
jgi:hypothetical protein